MLVLAFDVNNLSVTNFDVAKMWNTDYYTGYITITDGNVDIEIETSFTVGCKYIPKLDWSGRVVFIQEEWIDFSHFLANIDEEEFDDDEAISRIKEFLNEYIFNKI